jgi:probable HAF family extracellular repeat protein
MSLIAMRVVAALVVTTLAVGLAGPAAAATRAVPDLAPGPDAPASLTNLALGRPVVASATWSRPGYDPSKAVDGDPYTYWSSGLPAPQWIEVDLGDDYVIGSITAWVTMLPNGITRHRFLVRSETRPWVEWTNVWTHEGPTGDLQRLTARPTSGSMGAAWRHVRYVRVLSEVSPSWIAWREIEVYGGAAQPEWTMVELGTLGGCCSQGTDINASGQVVGTSETASGESHAFFWQDGEMIDLGNLGDSGFVAAADINNAGQVVGWSWINESRDTHAFLWERGVMSDLGTLGGTYSAAQAINNRGQIVGSSTTPMGDTHAFLWEHGVMSDLGTLGGSWSVALDINEVGQVIGDTGGAGRSYNFFWDRGVMVDIGTLGSVYRGEIHALNNRGQVVGYTHDADLNRPAFVWDKGVMTDLGVMGAADDINNSGQVVGAEHAGNAFLWKAGAMTDLGTLVGDVMSAATAINERGQIVGDSFTASWDSRAFIWENGAMTELEGIVGFGVYATDITDSGQVLGQIAFYSPGFYCHLAVTWTR